MKITAGLCRGMTLKTAKGQKTRPSSALLREAVMHILRDKIEESFFIDLFAGSGAMGLEALRRGAKYSLFVESAREALTPLKKNLAELLRRLEKDSFNLNKNRKTQILARSVQASLELLLKRFAGEVDLVWADPPYPDTLSWLSSKDPGKIYKLLKKKGLFVLESQASDAQKIKNLFKKLDHWQLLQQKSYGESAVSFIEKIEILDRP